MRLRRKEVFEDAFSAIPAAAAIVATGSTRRLVGANQAFADVLGYSPDALEQRSLAEIISAPDMPTVDDALKRLNEGATPREFLTARWRCADGSERLVDALFVVHGAEQG